MFENSKQPVLPFSFFVFRLLKSLSLAGFFIAFSLALGAAGYHYTEGIPWLDAFLNASMILTGMGPVNVLHTGAGKLFATFYALYSGVAFLTIVAIILAPIIHRFLHRLHFSED